jgi:hypothetical protein
MPKTSRRWTSASPSARREFRGVKE